MDQELLEVLSNYKEYLIKFKSKLRYRNTGWDLEEDFLYLITNHNEWDMDRVLKSLQRVLDEIGYHFNVDDDEDFINLVLDLRFYYYYNFDNKGDPTGPGYYFYSIIFENLDHESLIDYLSWYVYANNDIMTLEMMMNGDSYGYFASKVIEALIFFLNSTDQELQNQVKKLIRKLNGDLLLGLTSEILDNTPNKEDMYPYIEAFSLILGIESEILYNTLFRFGFDWETVVGIFYKGFNDPFYDYSPEIEEQDTIFKRLGGLIAKEIDNKFRADYEFDLNLNSYETEFERNLVEMARSLLENSLIDKRYDVSEFKSTIVNQLTNSLRRKSFSSS